MVRARVRSHWRMALCAFPAAFLECVIAVSLVRVRVRNRVRVSIRVRVRIRIRVVDCVTAVELVQEAVASKFDEFDVDDDLMLGEGELTKMLDKGSPVALAARELLAQSDIDGDGLVSVHEGAFRFQTHMGFAASETVWIK